MQDSIREALDWWEELNPDEKARWLQCEATPAEIDAELRSRQLDYRAPCLASVGDAYLAFKAALRLKVERTRPGLYVCYEESRGHPPLALWAGSTAGVSLVLEGLRKQGVEFAPTSAGKALLMREAGTTQRIWVENETGEKAPLAEWIAQLN